MSPCLGSDLVYLPRLEQTHQRVGRKFFEALLTPQELAYCEATLDRPRGEQQFFRRAGARIAAKEATAKALGTGLRGLGWAHGPRWQEIEVVSEKDSAPRLQLHGEASRLAQTKGLTCFQVSLSHDGDYALAFVLLSP